MEKFIFKKDTNVDWTSTQNEPFPLSTVSHSYDIEGQKEAYFKFIDDFARNFVKAETSTNKDNS